MGKILGIIIIIITLGAVIIFINKKVPSGTKTFDTSSNIQRSIYLGAWVGGFWDNDTKSLYTEKLTNFESTIDKKMAITNIYSEWSYLENKELIIHLKNISANGWTPMISANPFFFEKCPEGKESLYKTIAHGDCDTFLRSSARNLKAYGQPVFFRFAWEMNLPDMYWSVQKVKSDPQDFINAWRRFHTIFQEEKAGNVLWVLSFNTSHPATTPYAELYPGDEYVDWVAIDGYNWGDSHEWSGWASFSGVFSDSYNELIALTDKPVMLSEVNSAPTGGDKAVWLHDMLTEQVPIHFPQIQAIIFFNENKDEGESVDWRIEKSSEYIDVLKEDLDNTIYKSVFP